MAAKLIRMPTGSMSWPPPLASPVWLRRATQTYKAIGRSVTDFRRTGTAVRMATGENKHEKAQIERLTGRRLGRFIAIVILRLARRGHRNVEAFGAEGRASMGGRPRNRCGDDEGKHDVDPASQHPVLAKVDTGKERQANFTPHGAKLDGRGKSEPLP